MITQYQQAYKTKKFYNVYDQIIKNYNNKEHRTIKMAPANVDKKTELKFVNDNKNKYDDVKKTIEISFNIRDKVRLLKTRRVDQVFLKGALKNILKKFILL